jgi:hypothetical protein
MSWVKPWMKYVGVGLLGARGGPVGAGVDVGANEERPGARHRVRLGGGDGAG